MLSIFPHSLPSNKNRVEPSKRLKRKKVINFTGFYHISRAERGSLIPPANK